MLNFRKLRQDFASGILKEGKDLFDGEKVMCAKILHLDGESIRLSCEVKGTFENTYESELEIDRCESVAVDSNCDCSYTYDCQHIAALLFYLEKNINDIVVAFSDEADLEDETVRETIEEATREHDQKRDENYQKEVLREYVAAAKELGSSPFFLPPEKLEVDEAELAVIFTSQSKKLFSYENLPELQVSLRLPNRSKPLSIPNLKDFLNAVRYREPLSLGGKRYYFTLNSFDLIGREIVNILLTHARFFGAGEERFLRSAQISLDALGSILAKSYDLVMAKESHPGERENLPLPYLYCGNLEEPLCYSTYPIHIEFNLEYLDAPGPTLLMQPSLRVEEDLVLPDETLLFQSTKPGLIHKNTYYRFQSQIRRSHLKTVTALRDVTIPEPLFGTFIENALPTLRDYAQVNNLDLIERFITLPYTGELGGRCEINYLNGELEAKLFFAYDAIEMPAALSQLSYDQIAEFVGEEGTLARDLVQEQKLIDTLFQDFLYDEKEGVFRVKSEKKIVEFMTEVIPQHQDKINFECPENLSDQFIYDASKFQIAFSESKRVGFYEVKLTVDGHLEGVSIDFLWECIVSKRTYLELEKGGAKLPKILVLDLEVVTPIVQAFDEIGLTTLENHTSERPLWSLTTVNAAQFKNLPVKFSMTKGLKEIQKEILGEKPTAPSPVPKCVQAELRNYQVEGVQWLERLRGMFLCGILADDMGLGKTVQAITALSQHKEEKKSLLALIVCPTSLVHNWAEEFHKFNPKLKVLVVDGIPEKRRKLLMTAEKYDIVITSYNLLQKDIEAHAKLTYDYAILDEAQHIKNRGTRNAKSVKLIQATHRVILTGTPIENSLDELWSLFDFLMPGLLSTYERFVEKYIRRGGDEIESLRRKVFPFILRRMKEDVLDDLPPVSEILYHCQLSDVQKELYHSYAASAKEELSKLVKKEGFEKIQIHVLATLTRLKQICCHPAIFAKEKAEPGDSAKYDMLMELLPSLIEGNHKTVIFSQYTKMLKIMRTDLEARGIAFSYLDGSSKDRLAIVKRFNEDPDIPVFLVSLKAGGAGLNLVGADTVIHYDMWWNPAVENQATDRVHRIGQKKSVSSYKLVTLNSVEEKILNLQNRKKGIVKKVISTDEEAISKLTWEEVLELLQT